MELLAPAGSKEALIAAVKSHADAVYLGGKMYGARASAANFDDEELKWAAEYCRRFGVKLYVTVNTMIYDDEFDDLFRYVDRLVEMHVDALIVQDVGVIVALAQRYPDLPLHASTQMHIHNVDQVLWAKSLGLTRVVIARETPLEVIRKMVETGVEIETFIHGALCVSYSGQCLMSSVIGNRSANRGECAQPCRLPYTLVEEKQGKFETIETDGNFLISPKDLNTLHRIQELKDSGVISLKVEGRMKRPEYVAQVISAYRKQIDTGLTPQQLQQENEAMGQMFSRGFSDGFGFNRLPKEVLNPKTSSHVGTEIGTVIKTDAEYIHLQLKQTLRQGDGIRIVAKGFEEGFMVNFLYQNTKLVSSANGIAQLKKHMDIPRGAKIYKTTDITMMNAIRKQIDELHRTVNVKMHLSFKSGQPATLRCEANGVIVEHNSEEIVQLAQNAAMDEAALTKVLSKTKDTVFAIDTIEFDIDRRGFMPVSQLNQLRRETLQKLDDALSKNFIPYQTGTETYETNTNTVQNRWIVTVKTYEQKQVALSMGVRVFSENPDLTDEQTGLVLPRAKHHPTLHLIPTIASHIQANSHGVERIGDFGLNIANARAANYYISHGMSSVLTSVELSLKQTVDIAIKMQELYGSSAGLEVMVYGKRELMVMRACPISALYGTTPMQCSLCHTRNFHLVDRKGVRYRMEGDATCAMRVYESQSIDKTDEIAILKENGITNFRISLDQETAWQTEKLLTRILGDSMKKVL